MIVAKRRPARRHHFPLWGNILHDVVNAPVKETVKENKRYTYPAVNVKEYDNQFIVDVAVPGYDKNDIHINLDQDHLIISSERKGEKDLNFKIREFNYGTFNRKFRLPEDVDVENITASFKDGILSIHIPKAEEVKPRKIDIK
ncbi:MAG: Hsp20/alpha crystallin family protein [Saprospiraceae bacterium]|nr:Hsp20/alpha crystallin family protein [Saprospiraceae bacterium]